MKQAGQRQLAAYTLSLQGRPSLSKWFSIWKPSIMPKRQSTI